MENPSHHSNNSSSSSSSEDEDTKLEVTRVLKKRLIELLLQLLSDSSINKELVSTSSFTSSVFIQELFDGSSDTCYELMGMEKYGFISLCHMFREKIWLVDNKHLNVEEKMVMFFMTISQNLQNRLIKNRFQHSSQTIHKYFHEDLVAMVNFSKNMITPPSFNDNSNGISNCQLRQIFKVHYFLFLILHIIFVLFSYKNNYLYFKELLACRMLLVQLMELLSIHAFLQINKYHIKVVGEENVFRMLWQFVILT